MSRTRWFVPIIWTAFFLSGAAGLVYEVVWARYLNLILGGTGYAHVMVLAAYMGGMALGVWWFGRLADRFAEPLVIYAYLEIAIGLYALVFPAVFDAGSGLYLVLASVLGTTGPLGAANKLLVTALLLMPSTFLMGGTLPLLTRAVSDVPDSAGGEVAGLYSINSLGAVVGALSAGFFLIPALGQLATLTTAAAVNLAVGIGLLGAWRHGAMVTSGEAGLRPTRRREPPPLREEGPFERWGRAALLGAGLSGMLVMVYEVAWIRMLSTILGSSTYSFTLMLAAFITGIALGSALARILARRGTPFLHFGWAEVAMGLAMLVAIPLYARLPHWFLLLQSVITRSEQGYVLYELGKYGFCLALMLLPTVASGAALPLATDVAARLQQRVGAPVGRVFAMNTLGTILGALAGGLILLPAIGVKHTLELAIAGNLALGFYLLSIHPAVSRRIIRAGAFGCVALFLVLLAAEPSWDRRAFAAGVFREHSAPGEAMERFHEMVEEMEVLFYREDVNGTVAVVDLQGGRALLVNGKADASTWPSDQVTQTLIPTIPMVMVPGSRSALLVGLGSGQSAGVLLRYPIERVEVVEISPGVVEASRYFDEISGRPLEDPRTVLVMQDAKTYLLTRPDARYDLIISEPSNPWIAGIGGLFSLEYFQMLQSRLSPGGAVAQWIHLYEQSDETLMSVLVTFSEVFDHVSVWQLAKQDILLVGSAAPIAWRFLEAEAQMRLPGVAAGLSAVDVHDLYTILSQQMMSPLRVAELVSPGGSLNTDNFPFLEYKAPRAFFLDVESTLPAQYDERARALRNTRLALREYMGEREPSREQLIGLFTFQAALHGGVGRLERSAAAALRRRYPEDPTALRVAIASGVFGLQTSADEAARLADANPDSLALQMAWSDLALQAYDVERSVVDPAAERRHGLRQRLSRLLERVSDDDRLHFRYRLGQLAYDAGDYEEARTHLEAVRDGLGMLADPTTLFREIRRLLAVQEGLDLQQALALMLGAVDPRVPSSTVLTWLGKVCLQLEDAESAREAFRSAWRLDPGNRVAGFYLVELDAALTSGRFF